MQTMLMLLLHGLSAARLLARPVIQEPASGRLRLAKDLSFRLPRFDKDRIVRGGSILMTCF